MALEEVHVRRACDADSRVAVLLFGAVRDTAHTRPTYDPMLLSPLQATAAPADVFVHAMLTSTIVSARSGEQVRTNNTQLSTMELRARLGPACDVAQDVQAVIDQSELKWARKAVPARFINAVRAWYSLRRAAGLATAHEAAVGRVLYSFFAAVRSDTALYTPLTPALPRLALLPHAVVIPNYQHWHGLNDRFALGGREAMLHVYVRRLELARHEGGWRPLRENPESFLCRVLARANVSVILSDALCVVRVRADARCVARDLLFQPEPRAPRCLPRGNAHVLRASSSASLAPCAAGKIPASAKHGVSVGVRWVGANASEKHGHAELINTQCPALVLPPRGGDG